MLTWDITSPGVLVPGVLLSPLNVCLLVQINCVTFPLPGEGPEQQLLKPNEWSYCDYFWVRTDGWLHG